MTRPCFLVVDREYSGSISTRKLVIETAKFNVLTVYSSDEAVETLKRFPSVDGIVMDSETPDIPCDKLIESMRQIVPMLPIVAVGRAWGELCKGADYIVDSFDPARLLAVLQKLCPEQAHAVEKRNEELHDKE